MNQLVPAFVINLDRRPDRWAVMSAQFDRLGIEATRIPAIDGLSIERQDAWEHETNGNSVERILTAPEEGCLLSHCKAIGAFLRTEAPAALILEDDVELASDLKGLLASIDWWPGQTVRVVKLVTSNQPSRPGPVAQVCRANAMRARHSADHPEQQQRRRLHDRPGRGRTVSCPNPASEHDGGFRDVQPGAVFPGPTSEGLRRQSGHGAAPIRGLGYRGRA